MMYIIRAQDLRFGIDFNPRTRYFDPMSLEDEQRKRPWIRHWTKELSDCIVFPSLDSVTPFLAAARLTWPAKFGQPEVIQLRPSRRSERERKLEVLLQYYHIRKGMGMLKACGVAGIK